MSKFQLIGNSAIFSSNGPHGLMWYGGLQTCPHCGGTLKLQSWADWQDTDGLGMAAQSAIVVCANFPTYKPTGGRTEDSGSCLNGIFVAKRYA